MTQLETYEEVSPEVLEKVAFILKTISHPIRLGVVQLLGVHDQLSVNEICESLNTEQSLTSHHLANMKLKGILSCKRDGKKIMYSMRNPQVLQIISFLKNCECNM